jgi:hypothetical protein
MGDIQGLEKVNNTCVKTMHVGTMDKGFSVSKHNFVLQPTHLSKDLFFLFLA